MAIRILTLSRYLVGSLSIILLTAALAGRASQTRIPDPAADTSISMAKGKQTAVFAGGCFWGVEAVFEHLKGVSAVVSGYSGGTEAMANYELVSSGESEHAEAVEITYDPSQISYGQLLKIYFAIAHDPTELNRQGPDEGTQYRSAIFFTNDEQKQVASAYIQQLNQAQVFSNPIVTQLVPLTAFYAAEDYHQDFVARNPNYPYVVAHDLPKLSQLREQFPDLYKK
ncbi:peptide-methionine (S)-S-oxide reductase MsrA [Kamptonema animale CS-326]|jgi:peptide-methionine (S)-S-oxide reductase|uniref:peptide-methionine (S)-S-oxide reductase MsrA n=1 Tax=Kamptonema animale TaxID=92934 RepID=UPI00232ADCF3|nr:peptide-methionine (S)-S-oxide reductase MsrA [Kamptonema animale]MDB9512529.1 peptide-methionine (S)-S-oxide reductase MsrA [Kamptonema animale CS-326]